MRALIICIFFVFSASLSVAETVRIAVTTSFHNSGLADVLLPEIKADLGLDIQLLVVGTGQALRMGQSGDVDAVLVHAKSAEEAFVANGYGTHRREIMYNDFVLVGPAHDPAGVTGAVNVAEALKSIHGAKTQFVSRGDESGTHKKERALWQDGSMDPATFGRWYAEVGAGMGAALNTASGLGAYILTDRASWLNFGNKADLKILFSGDPALFNQYAFLPVNPERQPHVKSDAIRRLETWLVGEKSAGLINAYTIMDEQLFTFNGS